VNKIKVLPKFKQGDLVKILFSSRAGQCGTIMSNAVYFSPYNTFYYRVDGEDWSTEYFEHVLEFINSDWGDGE